MENKIFKVNCTHCGTTQARVLETMEAYVDYEYDFETRQYEVIETRDYHSPEYSCYACLNPFESPMTDAIERAINGTT